MTRLPSPPSLRVFVGQRNRRSSPFSPACSRWFQQQPNSSASNSPVSRAWAAGRLLNRGGLGGGGRGGGAGGRWVGIGGGTWTGSGGGTGIAGGVGTGGGFRAGGWGTSSVSCNPTGSAIGTSSSVSPGSGI